MAGIAWMEWKMITRSALFRICALVSWTLAVLLVHAAMVVLPRNFLSLVDLSELAAEAVELQIGFFLPTLVAFIAAASSARERAAGVPETLLTTPPTSEEFVVGKFFSVALAALFLLFGAAVCSILWLQFVEGEPARLLPFYLVTLNWWRPVLYVACLGYVAGLVMPGAAGGAVVVFYLIVVLLARFLVSPLFFPYFGYLSGGYLLFGLSLVAFAAIFYRRERRGTHIEQQRPLAALAVGLLAASIFQTGRSVESFQTLPFHRDHEAAKEAAETARVGEALPPFRLVNSRGEVITNDSIKGAPTLILLISCGPPPLIDMPALRALVAANRSSPVHLVLDFYAPDPAQAIRWGRSISPEMGVISQPAEPRGAVAGLPAMFGLGRRQLLFGYVAVIDSRGRFLGKRVLHEIVRPPSLAAMLTGGDPADVSPEERFASEERSAAVFLRALWQYDTEHRGQR